MVNRETGEIYINGEIMNLIYPRPVWFNAEEELDIASEGEAHHEGGEAHHEEGGEPEKVPPGSTRFWVYIGISACKL